MAPSDPARHVQVLMTALRAAFPATLPDDQIARWAESLAARLPDDRSEAQLGTCAANFARDHAHVEALLEAAHPDHQRLWQEWIPAVARILVQQHLNSFADAAVDSEDVVQHVCRDLVRALRSYRYESQFSTWVYSVVIRSGRRFLRDLQAAKRAGSTVALDVTPEIDALETGGDTPEDAAAHHLLLAEISAILRLSGEAGDRLAQIFQLWAERDLRLSDIGRRFNLSPARVSVLLQQARQILQVHPTIQAWAQRHESERETVPEGEA